MNAPIKIVMRADCVLPGQYASEGDDPCCLELDPTTWDALGRPALLDVFLGLALEPERGTVNYSGGTGVPFVPTGAEVTRFVTPWQPASTSPEVSE